MRRFLAMVFVLAGLYVLANISTITPGTATVIGVAVVVFWVGLARAGRMLYALIS